MAEQKATAELSAQILDELSRTVLVVGELLDAAFQSHEDFNEWVLENLPLHPRTAERIRAMYLVHRFKPNGDLPEAWKALWSLEV